MNNTEAMKKAFEAMMRKTFGEEVKLNRMMTITGEQSDEYRHPSVRDCWMLFSALASQAQQPNYGLHELAQIIMSDCGISTTNNDQLYDRILGRLIASSELQSQAQQHSDDIAVDHFAAAMKAKLAKKREQGRGGWSNKEECSEEHLQGLLLGHVAKGDPVDVGNFAMMLFNRGERTQFPIEAQQTESQWISVDERLPEMETPVVAMVGKNIYALARVDYDEGWLWAICGSDLSDIRDYEADDDYQPTYWMPLVIPPAPDVCSDGGKCGSGGYCITCPNVPAPEGGDK